MATAFALNHIVGVTSSPAGLTAVLVTRRALPALLMTRPLGARESQKPPPLWALKGRWQRAAGWVREGMVTGLARPLLDRRPTCPHSPRWVHSKSPPAAIVSIFFRTCCRNARPSFCVGCHVLVMV